MTLYDLGLEIQNIRTLLNNLEVKGSQNAAILYSACDRCTKLIEIINATGKELAENAKQDDKQPESEGDVNADRNFGRNSE